MKMKKIFVCLLLLVSVTVHAQKKSLTHNDYDLWKSGRNVQISNNGNIIVYSAVTTTGAGDGYLQIHHINDNTSKQFFNGVSPVISKDEKFVFFLKKPAYDITRKEKKDKVKKNEQSKNVFMVYEVATGRIIDSVTRVNKFNTVKDVEDFVIIEHYKDLKPEKKEETKPAAPENESKREKRRRLRREKKEGVSPAVTPSLPPYEKEDYLIIYQPSTKRRDTISNIKDYTLSKKSSNFIFSVKQSKKEKDNGVYLWNGDTKKVDTLLQSAWRYSNLSIDEKGEQIAYHVAMDSAHKDSLHYELFYQKNSLATTQQLGYGSNTIKEDWRLTSKKARFSEDGTRLFFYSQPKIEYTIDTTLLKEELPDVDVWTYKDRLTQPEQKVRFSSLKNKSATTVFSTEDNRFIPFNNYEWSDPIMDRDLNSRYALFADNTKYDIERSWEYPWRNDYYLLDIQTGRFAQTLANSGSRPILNPASNHVVYYNYDTEDWHSINLETNIGRNLTKFLKVKFSDEDDDHPAPVASNGYGGFDKDGNFYVYDKYDIWKLDPTGRQQPIKITPDGREKKITYRLNRMDRDKVNQVTLIDGKFLVSVFDHKTKDSSISLLSNNNLQPLLEESDYAINAFAKAKNTNALLYTKGNFKTYPDYYVFIDGKSEKISNLNPQQSDFKWGTVELFTWNAYDGTPLEGLLYKPEDFDPNKKYPLIVYFYEKYSDRLHSYRSPQPSASTVNFSYLVSNDYLVFVPDIVYKDGYPGQSAYNCIVSGTEALEKTGYVDSNAMALQGQSWGGYQTAYLVTKTNKYAAAMAGAPVSNMTSAYGGIRWGSGLSRAFQYERTQSRLGKNLWDGFDLYVENSPLFSVPKIETPLLMMHNDEDGAVPYYQGIEMFMAMRRLNKPAWLLVYNKEAHNLRKTKNRRDLSVRMMQFFDHYLKNEPAPEWMTNGLSRLKKGKQLGYELNNE